MRELTTEQKTSIERSKRAMALDLALGNKSTTVGPAMKELYDIALAERAAGNNGDCEVFRFNNRFKIIASDAAKAGIAEKFAACAEKYGFSEIK